MNPYHLNRPLSRQNCICTKVNGLFGLFFFACRIHMVFKDDPCPVFTMTILWYVCLNLRLRSCLHTAATYNAIFFTARVSPVICLDCLLCVSGHTTPVICSQCWGTGDNCYQNYELLQEPLKRKKKHWNVILLYELILYWRCIETFEMKRMSGFSRLINCLKFILYLSFIH